MQGLEWDEYDFVECLGAVPEHERDEDYYTYRVEKDGLILLVRFIAYRREVRIDLYQNEANPPLMRVSFLVYGSARRVKEKWGDYLEFTLCCLGDSYDWDKYWEANASNKSPLQGATAQLSATPSIWFRFDDEFSR